VLRSQLFDCLVNVSKCGGYTGDKSCAGVRQRNAPGRARKQWRAEPVLNAAHGALRVVLEMALTPILAALARQHPRLTVEVHADQSLVDIVAEGYDAGIRNRRAIQQDMVTTRLTGPFKAILVASRDYLDARGTPKSIADLYEHNCIGIRLGESGPIYEWELIDGKKPVAVKTSGTVLVTDTTQALSLALAGVGIAYVSEPLARRYVRDGSLKWLLPQTAAEHEGLFLYYPRRASLAPKLRAFIDVAKKTLKSIE
jgi:DNA-binding transcriptional LysR family regulator